MPFSSSVFVSLTLQGYDKTVADMHNYFTVVEEVVPEVEEVKVEEKKEEVETRTIVNTVPITLDETVLDLHIYEGQVRSRALKQC